MTRRLLPVLGVLLVAGAVAWALTGLPGPPVACLATGCDCEAAGTGPIRQPANAWSSLALAAAGIAALIASPAGLSGSPPPPPPPAAAGGGTRPQAAKGAKDNTTQPGGTRPQAPEGAKDNSTQRGEARPKAAEVTRLRALTRLIAATALTAAGASAFVYHAGLTAWAARLDGIAAAVLVGALALHGSYRLPRGAQRKPSPPALSRRRPRQPSPPALSRRRGRGSAPAEGGAGGSEQQNPAGKGGARGRAGGSRGAATWAGAWRGLAPWLLVALGGVCWWLGQNEGPWCRPDSTPQAHAAWHVLAAGGIGLWLGTGKPARTGPQVLPPSSLRVGESDTR